MRAVLVLAIAAASCYGPDAPAGAPCGAGATCPSGLSCRGGVCLGPGDEPSDAPGGADAAGDDTAAAPLTWRGSVAGSLDGVPLVEVVTSSPISGDAGDLYLAVVSVKPTRPVTEITGLGATWTRIREQCGGRDTARLAMFWARAAAATSGRVTASLNNGDPFVGSSVIAVHRYSGADPMAPIGSASWANTVGNDGNLPCSGGTDTQTYAWSSLDTTAAGSIVFVGTHTANYTHTPGAGYVEREDLKSGNNSGSAGLAVEERLVAQPSTDVLVTGSFSNAPDWSAIAVELRD